jgi:sn-glycerol 3-phosphate transport system permease protein
MEKRVVFRNRVLPYILVAPQIVITLVFFIWPASQALVQSFLQEDAFGTASAFVWFDNFADLFASTEYLDSFRVTLTFSAAVAGAAL